MGMVLFLLVLQIPSAVFFAWVFARLVQAGRASRLVPETEGSSCADPVSAVIPARNEAESLLCCLHSAFGQDGIRKVILVDDHSSDETPQIALAEASRTPGLVVLTAPQLPEGWTGKNHALHYGAQAVDTPYLLFMDADAVISPGTVATAVRKMQAEPLDHLGGFFRIRCATVQEAIWAPVLAASAAIALFGAADQSGSGTGAFNMVRTEFYRKIGGHEKIKSTIVDDVSLARLIRSEGGRTKFLDMSDRVSVRLFVGTKGFVAAVARSALPYLGRKRALAFFGGVGLGILGLAVMVIPFIALGELASSRSLVTGVLAASSWTVYLMGLACISQVRKYHGGAAVWGAFYPAAIVLLGFTTAAAVVLSLLGRRTCWRGRSYAPA
jgi:glycosyltransferase involved in cell wall biosynthesis